MNRVANRSWLPGLVLLSLLASQPLFAISPSYIMVYGGQLAAPVVLDVDHTMRTEFLWGVRTRREGQLERGTIATRLDGRRYLNFAVFWGRWDKPPVAPEPASQHGRLYLPTATEPAVIVVSYPGMTGCDGRCNPPAVPIPVDLQERLSPLGHQIGFAAGWVLNEQDLRDGRYLGIPGL